MNILSRVVDILCTLNEGYWLYRIVDTIYDRREGVLRLRDRRGLLWVMIGVYTLTVFGLNHIVLVSGYSVLIVMAEGMLCTCLFWECSVWGAAAVMGGYCMASILIGGTEISLTGMTGGERLIRLTTAEQGIVRAVYLLLCGSLWYGLNRLFCKWLKKQIPGAPGIKHIAYLIAFGLTGSIFLFNQLLTEFNALAIAMWYIFAVLIFIVLLWTYYAVKNRRLQEQIRRMDARNEELIRNYEQLNNYYKMNAKLYHDMNHHLNAIYYMAEKDGAEQVRTYIENIKQPINTFDIKPRTGIDVVDVMLYEAEKKSQEKGISIFIEAYAVTKELSMQKQDLCALFSNLLDNAVEAAQREVKVLVKMIHSQLLVQVRNDCSEKPVEKGGRFITSKADKSRHGFGIQNIRYVVKKYNGTVEFKIQEGTFYTDIMIG